MSENNITYQCYILPLLGGIFYVFLSLPKIEEIMTDWIPDFYYRLYTKCILLIVFLFLSCRILNIFYPESLH